jgi:hypothetical protein
MKHVLVASAVLALSLPVHAQWAEIGKDAEEKMTVYIDVNTLRRDGQIRNVWMLYDFKYYTKHDNGSMFRSMRVLRQFECSTERARNLAVDLHRQAMAGGELIDSSEQQGAWSPVRPQTFDATVIAAVCQ